MAAFENQSGPDLDLFLGQSWADWQNAVEAETGHDNEEMKLSKQSKEVAKLKRQDFGLFGFCPAKDDFYVVVCEHCHLPVKPQAFCYHIEKYHKEKSKTKASQKPPDPGGRSTLFAALTALSCDTPSRQSSISSEAGSTNSNDISSTKGLTHTYPVNAIGKKAFQDGLPASPNSKKRVSSGSDLAKLTKSPSKVKQQRLAKESSLARKNSSKTKVIPTKKPLSDPIQSSDSTSQSKSSIPFKTQDNVSLPVPTTVSTVTSMSLLSKPDPVINLNNTPVVVLEKPIKIDRTLPIPHSQTRERTNSSDTFSFHSPQSSIPTTSFRQYTHHHNPQFDIVKSPDRGIVTSKGPTVNCEDMRNQLVKPKKISSTLKVRDYDPNKHCGVWIPNENTNCTRSFTCKFHAKSSKRKVPGRRKPFDEMLNEHLRTRNKGKEKSETSKNVSSPRVPDSPSTSGSGATSFESSMQQQSTANKVTMQHAMPMQPPNTNKVTSTPKPKPSVQLFPRPAPVNFVDLWLDRMVQYDDAIKDTNQCYSNRHPSPLMVCHLGSRKMGANYLSYNRATDLQWNVLGGMSKQIRKQNSVNMVNVDRTTSHFTSIPPATAPVLNTIRTEKEALAQKRGYSSPACSSNCNFTPFYVRTKAAPSLRRLSCQSQRFRSQSGDAGRLLKSNLKVAAASIPRHPNSANPESLSAAGTVFVPMPLDHRLSNDARPTTSRVPSDVAFPSDVNLGFVNNPTSSTFPTNRNTPLFSQQANSAFCKRDIKLKTTPSQMKQSIKQEPVNGLSSTMLAGRTIHHRTVSSEPQSLEDYIFTDDSTNSKTIQLNQIDNSGRRGRFSQENKAAGASISNAAFNVDGTSDQFFEILSGNTAAPNVTFRNWEDQSQPHSVSGDKAQLVQIPNATAHGTSLGENWTTEILSLLESTEPSKSTSVSSSQNFSYTLRDSNFLTFSNDTSNIAKVSNINT